MYDNMDGSGDIYAQTLARLGQLHAIRSHWYVDSKMTWFQEQ